MGSRRKQHEKYLFDSIFEEQNKKENSKLDNEFLYFEQYKNYLLNRYDSFSFNDVEGCKKITNDYGEVLRIVNKQPIDFNLKECNYKNEIKSNLKLIKGIGVVKEQTLKLNGFNTLEKLTEHEKYSKDAFEILEKIDKLDSGELINLIKDNRYTKKCNLDLIKSASLFNIEDFKFMDIETLGLSNVPIILIGIAEIKKNKIISTQYLMEDISQEAAGLEAFKSHLDENSVNVTFNGKFFDIPYMKNRLNYYGIPTARLNNPHFDLLFYSRYFWKDLLPNCQLQTIEKYIFGIEREGDVPGQYIPNYYKTYLDQNNIGPLIPIIEHNKQDIISLAGFLEKMYNVACGD